MYTSTSNGFMYKFPNRPIVLHMTALATVCSANHDELYLETANNKTLGQVIFLSAAIKQGELEFLFSFL